jgi:predicted permease
MPPVPLPVIRDPAGFARVIVAGAPALIAVTVAAIILLLALFLPEGRREYALQAAASATNMARVVLGLPAAEDPKPKSDGPPTRQP